MEPDNCSPQLDYTRLLFNRKARTNCKVNNNNNTHGAITTNISESQEALDLMKTVLSTQFENEIMRTVDRYMDLFRRAASNIESNQGQHIPQNMLNTILQSMLKNIRQAVTRRYGQLYVTGNVKLRTLKIHKRKARTLENQRKAWLKQIRSKSCISGGVVEEASNLECTDQPVDSIEQLSVENTADSKCD